METGSIYGAMIIILFAPQVSLYIQVNVSHISHITRTVGRFIQLCSSHPYDELIFIFPIRKTAAPFDCSHELLKDQRVLMKCFYHLSLCHSAVGACEGVCGGAILHLCSVFICRHM